MGRAHAQGKEGEEGAKWGHKPHSLSRPPTAALTAHAHLDVPPMATNRTSFLVEGTGEGESILMLGLQYNLFPPPSLATASWLQTATPI